MAFLEAFPSHIDGCQSAISSQPTPLCRNRKSAFFSGIELITDAIFSNSTNQFTSILFAGFGLDGADHFAKKIGNWINAQLTLRQPRPNPAIYLTRLAI
ncbi:hypothetical protein [uncultured Cohaesibacter sp.]|uniref:hypothetical protein n=1 Tax=uncultured Cohaesibacter sp. TaxID=1002546 RepID=UPI002AA8049C|nr:hypothetical protein [uncultured Cohaesibacter sp.]